MIYFLLQTMYEYWMHFSNFRYTMFLISPKKYNCFTCFQSNRWGFFAITSQSIKRPKVLITTYISMYNRRKNINKSSYQKQKNLTPALRRGWHNARRWTQKFGRLYGKVAFSQRFMRNFYFVSHFFFFLD